jgi:arsenate reductase
MLHRTRSRVTDHSSRRQDRHRRLLRELRTVAAPSGRKPLRVLFVCTGNSARSQMAEAVLNRKGRGLFEAHSAGSNPAERVHPLAIAALREAGLDWSGHPPRGLEGLDQESWDFIITVCDNARESCPIFPGQPVLAHWGMADPAAAEGNERSRRAAFASALALISRRIDLLLALPFEKVERMAWQARVEAIARGTSDA